ncbi:Acg family FMN-binding oxidoreductase [Edaphobacter flagellatus]|uniref:Acg family FMN-binding oxidoreductase n=1 Tax=Edaphobacter flagellatus TaxID=1933044 RepID=UPI0021B3BE20|nr:nitroreductase family protein [Edaphobacter flagellatus]
MNRRGFITGTAGMLAFGGGVGTLGWRAATGSMGEYNTHVATLRAQLPHDPTLRDLIRYAVLAPSGHNTQPWRFAVDEHAIVISPDLSRATPVVDPNDHHMFVSMGCAAETLRIAAESTGRPGEIEPEEEGSVHYTFAEGAPRLSPLFAAIPRRQSTRADFDGRRVSVVDLMTLEREAKMPGVALVLVTERPGIDRIRDLVIAGNGAQMADPAFMAELKHWLRFNPRLAMKMGDGLFAAASGNPILPDQLGRGAFDLFFRATAENRKYGHQIDTASGIAVFFGDREDRAHWVAVGRACQRFALAATSLGLRTSFVNQPVEVARLRPELAALVGASGKRPDLVMRFGYGPDLPFSSRRPVDAVLS